MAASSTRETTFAFCLALRHGGKRPDDVNRVVRRGPGRMDVAGTRSRTGADGEADRQTDTQTEKAQPHKTTLLFIGRNFSRVQRITGFRHIIVHAFDTHRAGNPDDVEFT